MSRLLRWLVPSVMFAVGLMIVLWLAGPRVRDCYYDTAVPVWMLTAQDYQGECVELLPSGDAPPDADWRLYCTGMCLRDYPANRDYDFGPP